MEEDLRVRLEVLRLKLDSHWSTVTDKLEITIEQASCHLALVKIDQILKLMHHKRHLLDPNLMADLTHILSALDGLQLISLEGDEAYERLTKINDQLMSFWNTLLNLRSPT